MKDFMSSARESVTKANLNARKNEIADRLAEISDMLREKDINARRDELLVRLNEIKEKIGDQDTQLQEKLSVRLDELEAYIKQHPITAMAIALGAGFFMGNLFRKS